MRPVRALGGAVLVASLLGSALTGCGSGSSDSSGSSSSGSGSSSVSADQAGSAATGIPTTTAPGSALKLGQVATLDWSPSQKLTGRIKIKVTKLERTSYAKTFTGWNIPKSFRKRSPYFIRARVANVGKTDLGGQQTPLYGLSNADELVAAASFGSTFKACTPSSLPKNFGRGKSVSVCLVVLVPNKGRLVGVSYRPTEDVEPITWKGKVTTYTEPKAKKSKKHSSKKH
ncbi:MAG: hypothetical protein QM638_19125 [Nocardioides sp.]|uniref:hypothetical protein n=1 Tax=Nocardioides sp. TaxID=35761 RepID=UPI0039E6743D